MLTIKIFAICGNQTHKLAGDSYRSSCLFMLHSKRIILQTGINRICKLLFSSRTTANTVLCPRVDSPKESQQKYVSWSLCQRNTSVFSPSGGANPNGETPSSRYYTIVIVYQCSQIYRRLSGRYYDLVIHIHGTNEQGRLRSAFSAFVNRLYIIFHPRAVISLAL